MNFKHALAPLSKLRMMLKSLIFGADDFWGTTANSILLRSPPKQKIDGHAIEYTTQIASCTKKYYYKSITYTRWKQCA
jgi:hypothetical protein